MNREEFASDYLERLFEIKGKIDLKIISEIAGILYDAYKERRQIFVFGNGGSASTASHFACDLNKCACEDRDKKFKLISLADNIPTMLAISNDISYEALFVEQMKNFFEKGDIAIGISGSGNSENVLQAINYCNHNGGISIGISGFSGGKLASLAKKALVVPAMDMQLTEDYHMIFTHILMRMLKEMIREDA